MKNPMAMTDGRRLLVANACLIASVAVGLAIASRFPSTWSWQAVPFVALWAAGSAKIVSVVMNRLTGHARPPKHEA